MITRKWYLNFIFTYLIIDILRPVAFPSSYCPKRCACLRTTVRCLHGSHRYVPMAANKTTVFDLRYNKISELQPGEFKGLTKLKILLLNNNKLRKLKGGIFQGLSELRHLYLYNNRIGVIDKDAFKGIDNLEYLYIHSNQISNLQLNTFNNLLFLERLFLHNNKIRRVQESLFASLNHLQRLRLDGNPLMCDCSLAWLAMRLKKMPKLQKKQQAATCEIPPLLRGRTVDSLGMEELPCQMPKVMTEPQDILASTGETVYMKCKAHGEPPPLIEWFHNSNLIHQVASEEQSHFIVLDDGTLMIDDGKKEDGGDFYCMAKNLMGETKSRVATLQFVRVIENDAQDNSIEFHEIDEVIRFTERPRDAHHLSSDTAELRCGVQARVPYELRWRRNQLPLPPDIRYSVTSSGTLRIYDVTPNDTAEYACVVFANGGTIFSVARLVVEEKPHLLSWSNQTRVVQGQKISLACRAKGSPTPVVTWRKNGAGLGNSGDGRVVNVGEELYIYRAKKSDAGTYTCIARNVVGSSRRIVQVIVDMTAPPTILKEKDHVSAYLNTDLSVKCSAMGKPKPVIVWRRGGSVISNDLSKRIGVDDQGILHIRGLRLQDWGQYECIARNQYGFSHGEVLITILINRTDVSAHLVNKSVLEAEREVNKAIKNTIDRLNDPNSARSAHDLLTVFRMPSEDALELTRAAEIYERALEIIRKNILKENRFHNVDSTDLSFTDLISQEHLRIIAKQSGCEQHQRHVNCSDLCFHRRYRTWDGTCNNFDHNMWGAALTPFERMLDPVYENGYNHPLGWDQNKLYHGHALPSARKVSYELAAAHNPKPDSRYTHVMMQWGQFLDHDLDFTPQVQSDHAFDEEGLDSERRCNETCDNKPPCFPIKIPDYDPRITTDRYRCMGFTRSSAICGTGATALLFNKAVRREQINQITAFIDASNVYGSSETHAISLRDVSPNRGLMRVSSPLPGKSILPFNFDAEVDCQRDPNTAHIPCFVAGDKRANEQLGLLAMHTIWIREHNRIAQQLLRINPLWSGDMIYFETRKIIGAMMQHITYTQWLPKVLGNEGMRLVTAYFGYDSTANPNILNEFATSAFRFGHTLVNPTIFRLDEEFLPITAGNLPLHKAFFAPFRIVEEGGIDPILRGLYARPMKEPTTDQLLNTELTEKLFKLAHALALDLGALNIQRGRDHGLPSYLAYRRICHLYVPESFEELAHDIPSAQIRQKLKYLYGHPDNIDLWVGGLLEEKLSGGLLGPTFACIVAKQFQLLRDGDRFFYENPGVFTSQQLEEIRKTTLSRIFCENGDNIDRVQEDIFLNAEYPRGYLGCDSHAELNLTFWKDCYESCESSPIETSDLARTLITNSRRKRLLTPEDDNTEKNVNDERLKTLELMVNTMELKAKKLSEKLGKVNLLRHQMCSKAGKSQSHIITKDMCVFNATADWMETDGCTHCQCMSGHVYCSASRCQITTSLRTGN